jgi:hypothetical protein
MNGLTKICLRKINAFKRVAPCLPGKMKQHLHAYRRNDDGAMVILTLYFFIIFAIMGGLGLAVMRHEMNRAKLSVTTDAAILAAAGMPAGSTVAEIKAVVEDYFAKNDLTSNLNAIDTDGIGVDDIVTSLNSTEVTASASLTMNTTLLRLVGVDTLIANTGGTAKIATPKLEVSLVLDVSGSMDGAKIAALKVAAKQFVTTILNSGAPGDISISLIPFSMGVTPSDTIYNALNIDATHPNSNCIVFLDSDFNDTAIDPAIPYRQQIYTMIFGTDFPFDSTDEFWRSCYEDPYFEILPYSMSETALHNKIDSLVARGMTSGHLGVKWGTALLDPSFQSVATALKGTGEMDAALVNVPSNWGEPETLKIMVMMGDGSNTRTYYFNDPNQLNNESVPASNALPDYRGPGSDLYQVNLVDAGGNPSGVRFYVRDPNESDPGEDQYFDITADDWITGDEFADLPNALPDYDSNPLIPNSSPLSWELAWGLMSVEYYREAISDAAPWDDYVGQEFIDGGMKNTRMQAACSAAKGQGVVIYTIGFEVPSNGTAETELISCAQSVANYSPATTANIGSVFSAIASNVQNLRLTQ